MITKSILFDRLSGNFIAFFIGVFFVSLSTYVNGDVYGVWNGPMPVVLGLTLGCFWATRLHAYREAERIRLKYVINHTQRFIWRALIAVFIGLFVHLYGEGWTWRALLMASACTLYIGGLFWMTFDFMLNHDRFLPLFYVSSWYKTSRIDRFFARDPRWWLISKIVVYFLTLWIYVSLWR